MTAVAHKPGETCVETGTYVTDCEHEEQKTFNEGETFESCQVIVDDELYWHKLRKTGEISQAAEAYQTTCEHKQVALVSAGEQFMRCAYCPPTELVTYYTIRRRTGEPVPETGTWRSLCHGVRVPLREGEDVFPPCPGGGAPHAAYWKL